MPASQFGQNLTVKFTSATTFNVLERRQYGYRLGQLQRGKRRRDRDRLSGPGAGGRGREATLSPGTPATGDTFSLTPGGIASNGNILAMTGLSSQNLLSGQTLTSAYGDPRRPGRQRRSVGEFHRQAAQGVLSQVQSVQQSISGVNLDEQAADLITYQQAYQASAQVIASAQTLFQTLLTAVQAA